MKARTTSILLIALFVAAAVSTAELMVEGEKTEIFYTNSGTTVKGGPIDLNYGGGMDSQYYFKVGSNVPISYANFKISTMNSDKGKSVESPFIDVGVDGNREWTYDSVGYGKFGEQNYFSDGKESKSMDFSSSGGYNSANSIYIPQGADINEAEIEIKGRFIPQSISSYRVMADPSSVSMTGYAMEHGDIDGDGDIDIVVSDTKNYRIIWFENPNSSSGKWNVHTVYSGSSYIYNVYSIDVGDMDGDGDQDVVATSYSRYYVMYIRNNGQGNSWSMYRFKTSFYYAGRVRIADMDQDGNPDVVVASYYCYYYSYPLLRWYKAPSDPNTTSGWNEYSIYSFPSSYRYMYPYYAMDVGDFNGDGYPDVTLALYPQYTYYGTNTVIAFINPKTPGWSFSRYTVDSSADRALNLAVGDITGDGLDDIVAATYDGAKVTLYKNSNNGSSWSESTLGTMYYPRFVRIVDLNGDGKKDVVAGGGSGTYEFAIYTQGSSSSTFSKKTLSTEIINPQAFSIFDIDKDNDLDMMVAGTGASQLVQFEILNKTTLTYKMIWLEDGGVKDIRAMDYMDMDNDGDDDIILVGYGTGWVGWMEVDDSPFSGTGTLHKLGSIGSPVKVMCADADKDEDLDIFVLSSGGAAIWLENGGNSFIQWESYIITTSIPSTAYSMYAGDFTGDGRTDLAVSSGGTSYSGSIRLYEAPTDPRTPYWNMNIVASGLQYLRNIWADDMDLDGDLEILAAYGTYGSGAVNYYRNPRPGGNPMSGSWSSVSVGGGLYYMEDVKTIDITDDGYPDVVATGWYYYSRVEWFENPGSGGSFTKRALYTGNYDWNIAVGDIGDDGYADIVFNRGGSSYPTAVYWFEEPEDYATQSWIGHSLGSYSGTWALGIHDLDGDGIEEIMSTSTSSDEIRAFKIDAVFPQNVAVDIGADESSSDWVSPGILKGEKSFSFKQALQDVMDVEPVSAPRITDQYGTTLLKVPIEIYSSSTGKVSLDKIHITYNATVKIKQDGTGQTLAKIIDRLVPDYVGDDPYLRIYVGVGGRSEGQVYISDLSVEYNAIPRQVKPIPDLRVDEDTRTELTFDLAEYFQDDYTNSEDMSYRIALSGPRADKMSASIVNRKVVLDSTVTSNFYTRSSTPYDIVARIIVEDRGGPNNVPSRIFKTSDLPVWVQPVNDPPISTGEVLPVLYGYEGMSTTVVDLDDYEIFFDVDGDKLNYLLIPEFDDNYDPDANFEIQWVSSNNTLFVSLSEFSNWSGEVKVKMYATDQPEFNLVSNPSIQFVVEVLNINDEPRWDPIDDQIVYEDKPVSKVVEVSQFVHDIDTQIGDLQILVEDFTNKSFVYITLQKSGSLVYVSYEPKAENWYGGTTVTLSVTDGEFTDEVSFYIKVTPVNDPPSIRILEPIENGRIKPGSFSVIGEASDIEGIQFVEINFNGEWYLAKGLNTWGLTLEALGTDEAQESVPIMVRVFDGHTFAYDQTNITILPQTVEENLDFDGDGVPNLIDDFPHDVSEYSDRDGDGVGDFTDAFPDNPLWSKDSDKDGFADEADTHPLDPERWDDKDNDGRNDFLPPKVIVEKRTKEKDYTWPIILFILSGILLVVMVVSLVFFLRKRDASQDPRKMAKYYARQQRWRLARHDFIENLPLAKLSEKVPRLTKGPMPSNLPTPGRPGMVTPTMIRPAPALPYPIRQAPALPPKPAQEVNPLQTRPPQ